MDAVFLQQSVYASVQEFETLVCLQLRRHDVDQHFEVDPFESLFGGSRGSRYEQPDDTVPLS